MFFAKPAHSFFFSAVIGLSISALSAQNTIPTGERVRQLNNDLLRLHGEMQQISPDQWEALRENAAPVLAQRFTALSEMIQQNPHEALKFAFSPELADELAAKFPQAAAYLEKHGTWQGQVERWVFDFADRKSSREVLQMKVGQETFEVHFAGPEPAGLKSGDVLEVTGAQVGHLLLASGGTVESPKPLARAPDSHRNQTTSWDPRLSTMATTSTTTGSTCSTTGMQDTAVLFGYFPGQSLPSYLTAQNVYQSFFATTGRSLDGYWQEASYGQTSASGQVYGPYALSTNYGCTGTNNFSAMISEFLTDAANSGANFTGVTRLFFVVPDFGCGWAGAAYLPSPPTSCPAVTTPTGTIYATTSYVNGTTWQYSIDDAVGINAHEGGHNLGLNHSNSRAFGTDVVGPLGTQGTDTEYGDGFTAMTNGGFGHYDAPHKVELLNWIGPANYQVIQNSGTWTLQPLESGPVGLQALKVQRGTGNNAWLWIEYRQPIGNYDNSLANSTPGWGNQIFSGATIHYEDSNTIGGHSDLLDFTPTSSWGFLDPALAVGQTWMDPYTNISISVLSATSSGLTVSVSYGAVPCTPANPTVTVSPLDPSIYPGNSTGYTVSITNNDASACSASTFNLGSNQPSGWPSSFSATAVTLSPGKSGSVTMNITGPSGTLPGTYAVNANATNAANSTYNGSGTANVTVMSAPATTPTVTLSVPSTSYTRRSTVSMTATVMNGSTPVSGVSVTFVLTLPNGTTATQSGTTNRKGTVTWSYKLSAQSPTGKYSAVSQTGTSSPGAASMQPVTSNTVTFSVQ